MSETQDSRGRIHRVRAAITLFLHDRLQVRLSKLTDDDPKRSELIAQFHPDAWACQTRRKPQR